MSTEDRVDGSFATILRCLHLITESGKIEYIRFDKMIDILLSFLEARKTLGNMYFGKPIISKEEILGFFFERRFIKVETPEPLRLSLNTAKKYHASSFGPVSLFGVDFYKAHAREIKKVTGLDDADFDFLKNQFSEEWNRFSRDFKSFVAQTKPVHTFDSGGE